jgi:hypothetical protein
MHLFGLMTEVSQANTVLRYCSTNWCCINLLSPSGILTSPNGVGSLSGLEYGSLNGI